MRIISNPIAFDNAIIPPPQTDSMIDHLKWCYYVTVPSSREAKFAHSLLGLWSGYGSLSDKQQDAANDLIERVRKAYTELGNQS